MSRIKPAKRERPASHASNTAAAAAGSGQVGYSYDQVPDQPVPLKYVVQEVRPLSMNKKLGQSAPNTMHPTK